MKKIIVIAPTCKGVGLKSTSLGLIKALKDKGQKAVLLSPFSREEKTSQGFSTPQVEEMLQKKEEDKIIDSILASIQKDTKGADIILIEGTPYIKDHTFASYLNNLIAASLSAEIIFVTTLRGHKSEKLKEHLNAAKEKFKSIPGNCILGCILNKAGAPVDVYGNTRIDLFDPIVQENYEKDFKDIPFPMLGIIPWQRELMAPNIETIKKHLNATSLNTSSYNNLPTTHFILAAATIKTLSPLFKEGVMIITSGDRSDIIIATCKAYENGIKLAGMILTGGHKPNKETLKSCQKGLEKGLPILSVETDSLRTSIALQNMTTHSQKAESLNKVASFIASNLNIDQIINSKEQTNKSFSPAAFRYYLIEKAKAAKKTIILPEGDDIRVIMAANFCSEKNIAKIVLLGKRKDIDSLCKKNGCSLHKNIEVKDPSSCAHDYVEPLVLLRKHKGMTKDMAKKSLEDPIVVAMMMLEKDEVDGLVAGANTSTAKVVSPALKILKTAKGAKLVSSIFFMCLEQEVLVYGDCAINQDPTAQQLADIAIQSAQTAKKFDIDPRVAMISYSTGSSGFGEAVEKVKMATKIVQKECPNLPCDGPLQYDAAQSPEVAKIKAPNSPIAGKATIFIFPDLNTANTTYKAVQRTAGVLSIGPVLQGLKKPVNDLSRGATVDDIIYTIAITAIL